MTTTLKNTFYSLFTALLLSLALAGAAQAGSEEFQNDANDTIKDVETQVSELKSLLSDAREANVFTSYAEDELEDAEDLLEEANEEKNDEDWDEALQFARQAYSILEDAIEDLVYTLSNDAKVEIRKSRKLLELAEVVLDDTDKDYYKFLNAELALEDAEDLFDEAEDEFDDEKYEQAEHLAKLSYTESERVFSLLKIDIEDYLEEIEEKEQEEKEAQDAEREIKDKIEYERETIKNMSTAQKAQLAQIDLLVKMLMQIRDLLFTQASQN